MKTTTAIIRDGQRHLVTVVVTLLLSSTSGHAMNWEGHDDWMTDDDHALLLKHSGPLLPPPPLPSCSIRERARLDNVYEQAPLPGFNCRVEDKSDFCMGTTCQPIDD